jgi:copper resistance protein D
VDGLLVAVRAVHFASTAMTAGVLIFLGVVAEPVFRAAGAPAAGSAFRTLSLRLAWIGLALTLISGAVWLTLQTSAMSGQPLAEALMDGVVWVVLTKTQFGFISSVRLGLVLLLAGSLAFANSQYWTRIVALILVAGPLAAIAWTGHAAGTVGPTGPLHLAADAMHLLAAAAWIGGLPPLLLLLMKAWAHNDESWASIAFQAARRFSALGMVSVGTLLATGIVNSWILIGSLQGLVSTDYGQLVVAKIGLFVAMASVATVNRLRLMPRLSGLPGSPLQVKASQELRCNIMIEIALGFSVFVIVGVLGTLHPAIHIFPL